MWLVTVDGDNEEQVRWREFCEWFMANDIIVMSGYKNSQMVVRCFIAVDPNEPIDSTGSMPSLVDQAKTQGFSGIEVK